MVRIAITQAAFEAIAATLPLGSFAYEAEGNAKGGSAYDYPYTTRPSWF
jgi:hypothetical protein